MLWCGVRPSQSTSNSWFVSNQPRVHILVPLLRGLDGREKGKEAGQQMHCVAWIQNAPVDDCEQDLALPEALFPHGGGLGEDDTPFLPHLLLKEIFFAHSANEGVYPNQPRHQANLLCRTDWLCLRGIAATECAILPTRDFAAYPWCSACEHPKSGQRPSARRSFLALRHGRQRQLSAHGQYLRLGARALEVDLDVAGDYRPRVPGPESQPAVPFQPRLLLRELILAHYPSDPRRSIYGSPLTKIRLALPQGVAHTECVIIMFQATVND